MNKKGVVSRSIRRSRQVSRSSPPPAASHSAAVQVFLFRAENFLGSELFDITSPVCIGRHTRAELRLEGDTVSRQHCRLLYANGDILLEDLGSANGTYLNRTRVHALVPVGPSDAIQVGAYTLKVRPLQAAKNRRPSSGPKSDLITRVEAILTIGDKEGVGQEAAVDLSSGVDRRLYEDAIRRVTGAERPRRVPEIGSVRESGDDGSSPDTERSQEISEKRTGFPISDDLAVPMRALGSNTPSDSAPLSPDAEARLRDLDDLIASLDAKQREAHRSMDTNEFARDLASRLALDGRVIGEPNANTEAPPPLVEDPQRAREPSRGPPPLPVIPVEPPLQPALPPPLPQSASDPVPPPPLPRSDTPSGPPAVAPSAQVRSEAPDDSDRFDDVWTQEGRISRAMKSAALLGGPPAPRRRANSGAYTAPRPPQSPRRGAPARAVKTRQDRRPTVAGNLDGPATERNAVAEGRFEAVEVAARSRGKLVSIAVLRREGDQYILGHRTPQGSIAPASSHMGLKMLRINADRSVDLVFPREVAGHLVRGRDTVTFGELTEGRKYSCLRLETRDVATVILGEGGQAISYHIRFIRDRH